VGVAGAISDRLAVNFYSFPYFVSVFQEIVNSTSTAESLKMYQSGSSNLDVPE